MSLVFQAFELAETEKTTEWATTVEEEARDTAIVWEKERNSKMSAEVRSAEVRSTDAITKPALESNNGGNDNEQIEIECAKCDCCALIEECTPGYIAKVRERYHGRWICGLCSEAVKDEMCRSKRLISTKEALNRHMSFSKSFMSSPPPMTSTEELISAMRLLLRRTRESPRKVRSNPASPHDGDRRRSLPRSGSCFSTMAG